MKLRKKLGQHLLTDPDITRRIAAASGAAPDRLCLEIGPGTGVLTAELLALGASVTAVELDERMIDHLSRNFRAHPSLTIVHSDILKTDLAALIPPQSRPAIATGNLPYYITSPIIFKLIGAAGLFERITVMVQAEVGSRIAARPGDSDYGALSVFCSLAASAQVLFHVPRDRFDPPPRVDSCVVSLTPAPRAIQHPEIFEAIVSASFEHRRKTCYNSLRFSFEKGSLSAFFQSGTDPAAFIAEALAQAGISHSRRAQEIDIDGFAALAAFFARYAQPKTTDHEAING